MDGSRSYENMSDSMKERGRAFEAHYFNKLSDEKAKALKEKLQRKENVNALAQQTGIQDEALLNQLLDHGISSSELTALTLFPVAYVAWADGKLDDKEREAIAKACYETGIDKHSATMDLMNSWLEEPVGEDFFGLWDRWIREILPHMEPDHAKTFASNIHEKAVTVAKASRSFLGLGAEISNDEAKALEKIEASLKL